MVGLVVLGGTNLVSGVVVPCRAFDTGFSKEQNCAVWEKCGATPLTRASLQNNLHVRRELGDNDDATNIVMLHIQESNNVSTHFLLRIGYNGKVFKNTIKKVNRKVSDGAAFVGENSENSKSNNSRKSLSCDRRWPFDR